MEIDALTKDIKATSKDGINILLGTTTFRKLPEKNK